MNGSVVACRVPAINARERPTMRMDRRFHVLGVTWLVCAARRMFLVFSGAPRRVLICTGATVTALFIARLAGAEGQARRPGPPDRPGGLSVPDPGRWVGVFSPGGTAVRWAPRR